MKKVGRPRNSSKQAKQLFEIFKDGEWHFGYELVKLTGIAPSTLYPLLRRLAEQKLLESRWELPNDDKPPRKLYRTNEAAA